MIENLFKIAADKNCSEYDIEKFKKSISDYPYLLNEGSEDVFVYGENASLLDIALETDNDRIVSFLIGYLPVIKLKDLSNLLIGLSKYNANLSHFLLIADTFVWDNLETNIQKTDTNSEYTDIEKFINLVILNNNNHDIIKNVIQKYHARIFISFTPHNFNYNLVSNFYIENKKYKNLIYIMDNSVNFYRWQNNTSNLTQIHLNNIEKTVEQKISEYNFIVENEVVYQELLTSYQRIYFNKLNFLIMDIAQLCCFNTKLFNKHSKFFKNLDNTFILTFIESFFKKTQFSKGFKQNEVREIATFLNEQVKGNFLISSDNNFTKTQSNIIDSILSFHNDPLYVIFFSHFKLFLNKRTSDYFNNLLCQSINCTIEHLLELIKIHQIKKIESGQRDNTCLFNIIIRFEEQYGKNGDFSILKPLLRLLTPNFIYKNDMTEPSKFHFFVSLHQSAYYSNLLDFYKPNIKEIISSILLKNIKDTNSPRRYFYEELFKYIKLNNIKEDVIFTLSELFKEHPFSHPIILLREEEKRIYIVEVESYKIAYEMQKTLHIEESIEAEDKKRKRL